MVCGARIPDEPSLPGCYRVVTGPLPLPETCRCCAPLRTRVNRIVQGARKWRQGRRRRRTSPIDRALVDAATTPPETVLDAAAVQYYHALASLAVNNERNRTEPPRAQTHYLARVAFAIFRLSRAAPARQSRDIDRPLGTRVPCPR